MQKIKSDIDKSTLGLNSFSILRERRISIALGKAPEESELSLFLRKVTHIEGLAKETQWASQGRA